METRILLNYEDAIYTMCDALIKSYDQLLHENKALKE
jgi:hypothetical protein